MRHKPLLALKKSSVLAVLAPGSLKELINFTATFAKRGRRGGERCLEILTCHFPPCENAVAAEWVSIKRKIALMCGKGKLSAASVQGEITCMIEVPPARWKKENESSANKAISSAPLHARDLSDVTYMHGHTVGCLEQRAGLRNSVWKEENSTMQKGNKRVSTAGNGTASMRACKSYNDYSYGPYGNNKENLQPPGCEEGSVNTQRDAGEQDSSRNCLTFCHTGKLNLFPRKDWFYTLTEAIVSIVITLLWALLLYFYFSLFSHMSRLARLYAFILSCYFLFYFEGYSLFKKKNSSLFFLPTLCIWLRSTVLITAVRKARIHSVVHRNTDS